MAEGKQIEKLLAVLDIKLSDQINWTVPNTDRHPYESLADLAFRLRDEVVFSRWQDGLEIVRNHYRPSHITLVAWALSAKPIHWIIAALIAKELAKDG